jgi:hypothetical protein
MGSIAASRNEGESGSGDAGTVFSLSRFDRAGSMRISIRGGHRVTRQPSPSHPSTTPFAGLDRRDDAAPCESDPDSSCDSGDDQDRRRIVVHSAERMNPGPGGTTLVGDTLALQPAGELLGTTGNIWNWKGRVNAKTQTTQRSAKLSRYPQLIHKLCASTSRG